MDVKKIKLSQISELSNNLRKHSLEDQDIIDIAEDIKYRGLMNSFTVYDNGDGTYTLGDGSRRYHGLLRLVKDGNTQFSDVVVNVQPKAEDIDILANQMAGNANVKTTGKRQFVLALQKLAMSNKFKSEEALAKHCGISIGYLRKLLSTLSIPEDAHAKAEQKNVSVANLITLADIANKVDDVDEWVNKASEMKAKDFMIAVGEELEAIKKAKEEERKGKEKSEPTFEPKAKVRGKDFILSAIASAEEKFAESGDKFDEGKVAGLKYAVCLDENSVEEARQEWEQKQKDKAEKAEQRKVEREKQKLKENSEKYGMKLEPTESDK